MDKPDALWLAEVLEADLRSAAHHDAAAAELRRLSEQRDALLEALKALLNAEGGYEWGGYSEEEIAARDKAFAAIKAVEEKT